MRRAPFIVLLVVFVAALACGSEDDIEVREPESAEAEPESAEEASIEEAQPDPTEAPPPTEPAELGTSRTNPAPLASEVSVSDVTISITGATRPATDIIMAANMFNTEPETGQEYILVDLMVVCDVAGDETCSISPFNFSMVGSNGEIYDAEIFVAGLEGTLESTDIFGGATLEGSIPFIVGQGETNLVLIYEPSLFDDEVFLAVE
jgi:hypothetical protein